MRVQRQRQQFREIFSRPDEMQREKKASSAVEKTGPAVGIFQGVQVKKSFGAVGMVWACSKNSKKFGGVESVIKAMVQ